MARTKAAGIPWARRRKADVLRKLWCRCKNSADRTVMRLNRQALILLLAFALMAGHALPALASPATFITALPISQDQLLVRFTSQPFFDFHDSSPLDRDLSLVQFPTTFFYGATSTLALALEPEQQFALMGQDTARGRVTRSASGFGDTLFFARYTLVDIDWPLNTIRVAPLAGAFLPTGYYDKSDHLGLLPEQMQSGSGSVDPYLGVTAAWDNPVHEISWDATWRANPPASPGYRLGDEVRTDGQFQIRLWPYPLPTDHVPYFVWLDFETNLIWDARSRINGVTDNSTGGFTWLFWGGIQLQYIYWEAGALVGVPLLQKLNGPDRLSNTVAFLVFFEYYLAMPSWISR